MLGSADNLTERGAVHLGVGVLFGHFENHLFEAVDLTLQILAARLRPLEAETELEVFFVAHENVGDGSDLVESLSEFRFAALPEGGAVVEVEAHENAVLLRVGGELKAALGRLGAHRCDKAGKMQHLHAVLAEELGGVVILRVERPAHFTGAVVPHARSAKPEAGIGDVELVAVSPGSALRHVRPDVGDVARAQLRFDERGHGATLHKARQHQALGSERARHVQDVRFGARSLQHEAVGVVDGHAVFRSDAKSHARNTGDGVLGVFLDLHFLTP